ncbi:hypothetical protein K469DRAFT_693324 [Zopfia rhizophila CBS 207.26]|uniref:Uncharacterized protein n=1 Tax=Zopfia rhizophila CBS 207.26 TaxID=1314779 RepID=A0A6A6EQJ8_9PEZI|nr:hypothetical protein K469DRAFT_693324 [Zopfia rhizophila CBS 207.26]
MTSHPTRRPASALSTLFVLFTLQRRDIGLALGHRARIFVAYSHSPGVYCKNTAIRSRLALSAWPGPRPRTRLLSRDTSTQPSRYTSSLPPSGYPNVFSIVFPSNRIVVGCCKTTNSMLNGGHALPITYPATMNNLSTAHPSNIAKLYHRDQLQDSQESFVSTASSTFTAPRLLSSSSNISNSTAADTEFTSPGSSNAPSSQNQIEANRTMPPSPTVARGQHPQATTTRIDTNAPRTGDTAASPMSVEFPVLTQGSKRTASGTMKNAGLPVDSSVAAVSGHRRNISVESNSNPRTKELSARLRARLSYAMVKVENGWEKRSIEELEELPSQRGSPVSALGIITDGSRPSFDSPRTAERQRRPSGVSESSDQMMLSPGQSSPSDVSRSLAATPSSYWRSGPKRQGIAPLTSASAAPTDNSNAPVLAPPVEIGSRRKRRSSASHAPPPLLSSTQRKHYSDLGAGPRTPTTAPRVGILRMPSQQAEKDAVDTLLFMSSPNNSSRLAHTSVDAQPSPLRSEMAPSRRVMFQNHNDIRVDPTKSNTVQSPQQREGKIDQRAAYTRADSGHAAR